MAVGNFTFYNQGKARVADIDLDAATVAWVLLTDSYTPAATHDDWTDISATECADGDYSEQSVAVTVSESAGTVTLGVSGSEVSFGTSVTITAKYLVAVIGTAGSLTGTDKLIGYADLSSGGGSVSSASSTFKVTYASGFATY
jgi:hypothetical protein